MKSVFTHKRRSRLSTEEGGFKSLFPASSSSFSSFLSAEAIVETTVLFLVEAIVCERERGFKERVMFVFEMKKEIYACLCMYGQKGEKYIGH